MNVLSKMLDATIKYRVFTFHPKCKKVGITHLFFVNDLLIFSKGHLNSIIGIQNVLNMLYSFFGLQLNCAKSEFYAAGIKRDELQEIHQVIGFKIGTLPIRYLGVPLVTKRLSSVIVVL